MLFFVNILKRKHLRLIYHVPNGKQSLKKFVAVLAISYLKKTTSQAPSSKTASNTIYKFDLFLLAYDKQGCRLKLIKDIHAFLNVLDLFSWRSSVRNSNCQCALLLMELSENM